MLQCYMNNPMDYYHTFVAKKQKESQVALEFGDAIHETCLQYFLGHRQRDITKSKGDMTKYFERKLNKNIEEGNWNATNLKELQNMLYMGQIMCCKFWDENQGKEPVPTFIEKELSYEIDGELILNTVDRIHVIDTDFGKQAIVKDLKTSSKPYDKGTVFSTFQLRSYALAVELNLGIPVKQVEFNVLTKSTKPSYITYCLDLSSEPDWQEKFTNDLKSIIKAIKAGVFYRKYDNYFLGYYSYLSEDWGIDSFDNLVLQK